MKTHLFAGSRLVAVAALFALVAVSVAYAAGLPQETFEQYCAREFAQKKTCPEKLCWTQSTTDDKGVTTTQCLPKLCPDIAAKDCPEDYCAVMTNCANEKICHFRMAGEPAQCGDLAYAGQDVDCCAGLVRRCGVEFIDGTCDMEGKNSVYNIPICIPCGDGVCSNFENRCNCPEDCGKPLS